MEEYQRIRAALAGHSEQVFDLLVARLALLGSKVEWSLDDNLEATEELVRLAETIGLPPAGDQNPEAVEFYRAAAAHVGLDLRD
mgnify:CR=1 FL=1